MHNGNSERDKSRWDQNRQGLPLGTYSPPFCSVPAPPRRCMQRMGNFKYETQLFVRSRSSLNRAFDAEILQKFSQKQLYAEQMHPGNIAYALWNQNFWHFRSFLSRLSLPYTRNLANGSCLWQNGTLETKNDPSPRYVSIEMLTTSCLEDQAVFLCLIVNFFVQSKAFFFSNKTKSEHPEVCQGWCHLNSSPKEWKKCHR